MMDKDIWALVGVRRVYIDHLVTQIEHVRAENAKMREALDDIATIGGDYDGFKGQAKDLERLIDELVEIARKALIGDREE